MLRTILTIVISGAFGVGSTLLVQTVILQPVPVVLACPEVVPETDKSPGAFREMDTTYTGQGRPLKGLRTGKELW
jgi:signal recognition particle receptor subunit beta